MSAPTNIIEQYQRDLTSLGYCPFCQMYIRKWREYDQIVKEYQDEKTGHAKDCEYKEIIL